MKLVKSGKTMDRIATDIIVKFQWQNRTTDTFWLCLTTKWTESFPMPNLEAATVARIIVKEVVARIIVEEVLAIFGVPSCIQSDQGWQYESELFLEMSWHIEKTRTTPYHHQSDGMVERFKKLCWRWNAYVNEHHADWDKFLPYVMMTYIASIHETTGFIPNYMMLGREILKPLDLMYEMSPAFKFIQHNKWTWQLKETLEDAHRFVWENINTYMIRQKQYHDQKFSGKYSI